MESEIKQVVKKDNILSEKTGKLETRPGVGFMTIACILGETNAFALLGNSKQLVSYRGLTYSIGSRVFTLKRRP